MENFSRMVAVLFLMLASGFVVNAQIAPNSAEELMEYFERNHASLDPIEGVYDVYVERRGMYRRQLINAESTSMTAMIYRDLYGDYKLYANDHVTIKRIGNTPMYSYNVFWARTNTTESKRFVLRESMLFEVEYAVPERQLRYDFGINYQLGLSVHFASSFVKTYPSPEVYKKRGRQSAELEEAQARKWSGTGFALEGGYIVTNYHVVEDARSIYILGIRGDFSRRYSTLIVATDRKNDLALLKISDPSFGGFGTIPYSVKTSVADVGEEVFVLGYPLISTMGDEIKLTTGVVSARTGFMGDVTLYQISAPIQPGNSGGPLFDAQGNLVGIVNAKHKSAENVGYAIKTSYLKNLVESTTSAPILPNNNVIGTLPLTSKVKTLKNFVFMITCSDEDEVASVDQHKRSHGVRAGRDADVIVSYPVFSLTTAERLKIKSVRLTDAHTAIEVICSSQEDGPNHGQWYNIDRETYISIGGKKYKMTKAVGVKTAPDKTYFNHAGEEVTFTLYFPPIPKSTTKINLVESADSSWKFYGIELK